MAQLIVSASASPLFGNFLMVVSVSDTEGLPTKGLKAAAFQIHHMASLNHAGAFQRAVDKVTEAPEGFYIVTLKPAEAQPTLPPGHYVFAVAVRQSRRRGGESVLANQGQTVATGDLPK